MSIRLRFTLLYNAILALTLAVFGLSLYSIQAGTTLEALKKDLIRSSETVGNVVLQATINSTSTDNTHQPGAIPPPIPFQTFSNNPSFQSLPEREIVRVLDAEGNLVASPFGRSQDALPLGATGLKVLQGQSDWWENDTVQGQAMLIYSRPITVNGKIAYILQVARSLDERDRSLRSLATILVLASLLTILVAFGIGWLLSEITLSPIKRLTETAHAIGKERDFARRVSYNGPQDEVGRLATTFNSMLAHLQDAYQQVAHSLEAQRNFVADVSHELRTPLTTLRGNLGLLHHEPPIPADEQADILADLVDESDRLIRLVNDLLVLARADAGRNLVKQPLAILPVLEETCRQACLLDPGRRIQLDGPEELAILGDHDTLKQVLLIALDNALKHSTGDICVSAVRTGEQVEIRVRDSGEGIPPEKLEHIFDRFYRGGEGNDGRGFGLGLSIAKSLVEGQGDTIKIDSEPGKGTVVILSFAGLLP
jgi:signal transduction histidine kinase